MPKNKTCFFIDFDGTIIKKKVNGEMIPSIISILRKENHLNDDYTKKAYELEEKYRPIENDHNISFEQKFEAMNNWWTKHFELLIENKLNLNHIKEAANSPKIILREGFNEFANLCHKQDIPIIIFSASGIGFESVKFVLIREGIDFKNIHILSNEFQWQNDIAVKVKNKTIHSLNKNFETMQSSELFQFVKDKENVIVIGDNVNDILMGQTDYFKHVLNYGILNDVNDENLERYKKVFDKVLLDGESFLKIFKELD